jgi:hypothetical protein
MRLRSDLTVEKIKEMLREVLEDFMDELIEELRGGITPPVKLEPNDPLVRTAEVCLRWWRAEPRSANSSRPRSLCLRGGMGIRLRSGLRALWNYLAGRFDSCGSMSIDISTII